MTTDEFKSMPKGHFILMKTGKIPMKTVLKLFKNWKIKLNKFYNVDLRDQKQVDYADMGEIEMILKEQYNHIELLNEQLNLKENIKKVGIKIE